MKNKLQKMFHRNRSPRPVLAVLMLALLGVAPPLPSLIQYAAAVTNEPSYWLKLGSGRQKIECPDETGSRPFRVSNYSESWAQVTGVVICKDVGSSYAYEVNFLGVEINPEQRGNIGRESLIFDWIGLAIYGPDGKGGVDWQYDEVLPIRGLLHKQGNEKIYFGNLHFRVPKEKLARADHFVFYMTAQGVLISIYAL